ncbi:MAG: riboflavin biosynthesis protein RibF [Oscillospiraceae bacterium]
MKTAAILPIESARPLAVAVGFFDGVHRGHLAVIHEALAAAHDGSFDSCVFSFSMNGDGPAGKRDAGLLQSSSLKAHAIEELGVNWLLTPPFSELRGLSPEAFALDVLYWGMGARVVCCGYDYRFGRGAAAGPEELRALLAPRGVRVIQVGAVLDEGEPVSSTRIRAALRQGDCETAGRLLGRPYAIDFEVTHGRGLGKTIGFPTINQPYGENDLRPRFGVYATWAMVDGIPYPAVTNVGVKPTVGSNGVSAESYIEGFSGDLYGKRVETRFIQFLRPEQKFGSIDALRDAIGADSVRAQELLKQKKPKSH